MSRRRIFRYDLNSGLHVATCLAKRQVTARNDTESFPPDVLNLSRLCSVKHPFLIHLRVGFLLFVDSLIPFIFSIS